jgi:hypothetical protein
MKNLTEKALIVNLRISTWTARKYDRKVTDEVNQTHNATDAGRFNKILVAKESLKAIQEITTKARTFHYENTLPWGDNGERLLSTLNYLDYQRKISEIKNEFDIEVNKLVLSYPTMIEQAKKDLNGLFNESDYPTNIAAKFNIKTTFVPIPETQDFRVDLSEVEIGSLKRSLEHEMSERFVTAQNDIYKRVIDHLKNMQERLSTKDAVFRDSLFQNVLNLIEVLPLLNITNDAGINEMHADLQKLYTAPDNVRKSVTLRDEKAKQVEEMLNKFTGAYSQPIAA